MGHLDGSFQSPLLVGERVRVTTGAHKDCEGRIHDIEMRLAPFIYGVVFPWDDGVFGFQRHELESLDA